MCHRTRLLADSDSGSSDGAHMDSVTDTPDSRDHEPGGGSINIYEYCIGYGRCLYLFNDKILLTVLTAPGRERCLRMVG